MDEIDGVRNFAKQAVCPLGDIGFYYPATVYVGENSLLYCTHEYTDEIEVYTTPAEILEDELKGHPPVAITKHQTT